MSLATATDPAPLGIHVEGLSSDSWTIPARPAFAAPAKLIRAGTRTIRGQRSCIKVYSVRNLTARQAGSAGDRACRPRMAVAWERARKTEGLVMAPASNYLPHFICCRPLENRHEILSVVRIRYILRADAR